MARSNMFFYPLVVAPEPLCKAYQPISGDSKYANDESRQLVLSP